MTIYTYAGAIIFLIIGVFLGALITRPDPDGILHVNTQDPEKDLYTFEITIPLDEIANRKILAIKVDATKSNPS